MNLLLIAIGGAVWLALMAVGTVLWKRWQDRRLRERIKQAAGPISRGATAELEPEESIFRQTTRHSRISRAIRDRYPLINPRRAIPMMILAAVGASIVAWLAMWFLQISRTGGAYPCSSWFFALRPGFRWAGAIDARKLSSPASFRKSSNRSCGWPVQACRRSKRCPSLPKIPRRPRGSALQEVCEGLNAGLDAETALGLTSRRIKLVEFTLFASVIRLQRRSGGGITASFSNLAATLRENRTISLNARAATAQTRLTLMVLTAMPAVVLGAQYFISPEAVNILFNTEQGIFLLRMGIALIVIGLLVARSIGARFQP